VQKEDIHMSTLKESLYSTIDQLNDDETRQVLEYVTQLKKEHQLIQRLVQDPAIKLPPKNVGVFEKVEPIVGSGLPASECLSRDRR